ncbi:cytidine deaminase [Enterovirga rhinocerotis]|uniref:Cytidine deaminase n=1 Tax=Enterovirga rhinocerotis TaxID=1339210 RepID=A0A4R7BWB1_9HYPH|nr:cytidine deaminase [Enterovirga rhinocerotis]TDR90144.1 cytidine deaminase [Enterovirga rhinocerotis]
MVDRPAAKTDRRALLDAAATARNRAYAPYSRFPVGAAIATASGRIFAGCNVENASYPVGTCAEAGAIAAMVAAGETRIAEIVILGGGRDALAPCGACRQRILEFADGATQVHMASPDGIARSIRAVDLLPEAFGPTSLRPPAAPDDAR